MLKKTISLALVMAFTLTNIPVSHALLITSNEQNKNSNSGKPAGQLTITTNNQNNQVNNQNALIGLTGSVVQPVVVPVTPVSTVPSNTYASGNLKTIVNADGSVSVLMDEDFYGNRRGRIAKKTMTTGNVFEYTYFSGTDKVEIEKEFVGGTHGRTNVYYRSGVLKERHLIPSGSILTYYESGSIKSAYVPSLNQMTHYDEQGNVIDPDRASGKATYHPSGNLKTIVNDNGSVDEFMDENLDNTKKGRKIKSTMSDGTVYTWTYYGGSQSNKIYNEKKFINNVLITEKIYNPHTDALVYTIHFHSNGQRKEVINHATGDNQSFYENGNYKTMYFAASKTTWIYSENNLVLRINKPDGSYDITESWSEENRRAKSYKQYDKDGKLILSKQYDENGQEIVSEDPNITRYASGNLKTRTNQDGSIDEFLDENYYGDRRGRLSKKTLSTGNAYKMTYHGKTETMMSLDHLIQGVINATFLYDATGKNITTTYFYPSGARKAFHDHVSKNVFTYYENGRYETITTGDGTKYAFTSDYSELRVDRADGTYELYTYWNANFQLKTQSKFTKDGQRMFANAFDQKNRLIRHDKGDNSYETYEYWGDTGKIKTQNNYNPNGQLLSTKNYDEQGNEIIEEPDNTRYPSGNLKIRENADGSIDVLMDENFYGDNSGRVAKKSYGTNYYLYTYHPNSDKAQTIEYYPLGGPKLTLTTHDTTGKKLTETVFYSTGVKKKYSDFAALEFINYYESGKVWTSTIQGVTSTFNEDGLITKKEQVDRSYETFVYWPNKVLKTHTKFDRNNNVLSKKEYDETGKEILPGPALDKAKVLKSIELAIQDAMGASSTEYWFFNLNNDTKIDALDMTLFKNWEALPQQDFIRIYTMIWSAIDSLKMDDSGGHHHHSSGTDPSPLDLDGDGMIMEADKKALEIMISAAQKDILTATVKALESATAAHHAATAGHAPYVFQSAAKANPNLKIFEVVFKSGTDEAKYLVMLGNTPDQISIKTLSHAHADNAQKAGEHEALFNLVKIQEATNAVVKSGNWSDASIWADGKVPATNARIWIPTGITVTYDVDNADLRLETVRVDGKLNFATDRNTTMKVETLVVDPAGVLTIGTSATNRVAADKKARIIIADRGTWDYTTDTIDIGGGLISHGQLLIYGAEHTSFMDPVTDLKAGVKEIAFASAPKDWKVGDKIIVPSTTLGGTDEEYTIIQMKNNGTIIVLDKALLQDRDAPDGIKVPIGNLTRNVVIESESLETSRRGHVMLMHKPGNQIDSAAFNNLGRTTHEHLNDVQLGEDGKPIAGTSTNQRGRYSLHFHRNGATPTAAPNIVRNVAIDGGLKWGLVNHDSNVDAQYNVTYNINGAHIASEVGTELGIFAHNLSVKSNGSKTETNIQSRIQLGDFGHAGHGIWLQGTLIMMHDNFAFGHSDAAFFLGPWEMKENGQLARVKVEHLSVLEPYIPGLKEWKESLLAKGITTISNADAPHYFTNLYAAASKNGFTTWDHFRRNFNDDTTPNILENSVFWNVAHSAVRNHYGKRLTIRNVKVYRNYPAYLGNNNNDHAAGFEINAVTEDTTYDNVHVFGFMYGIGMNYIGDTIIKNSYIDSYLMFYARLGTSHGRKMTVSNTTFGPNMKAVSGYHVDYDHDQAQTRLDLMFSIRDTILFDNISWAGKEVKFNDMQFSQGTVHPDWVPVTNSSVPELNGKTNQQLWDEYGLWLGGGAPRTDVNTGVLYTNPQTIGDRFIGHGFTSAKIDTEKFPAVYLGKSETDSTHIFSTNQLNGFAPKVYDDKGNLLATGEARNLKEGWNIVSVMVKGQKRGFLIYGDVTPGRIELRAPIREDYYYPGAGSKNPETGRSYGTPFYPNLVDVIDGKEHVIQYEYVMAVPYPAPGRELTHARIEFSVTDAAGNISQFFQDVRYPQWYLDLIKAGKVNPLTMSRDTL